VCLCLCVCRAYACVCDAFQYWNTYHLKIVCTCLYPLSLGIRLLSSLSCSIPRSFFLCLSVSTPSSFSRIALPTPPLTPSKNASCLHQCNRTYERIHNIKASRQRALGLERNRVKEFCLPRSLSCSLLPTACRLIQSSLSLSLSLARSVCPTVHVSLQATSECSQLVFVCCTCVCCMCV